VQNIAQTQARSQKVQHINIKTLFSCIFLFALPGAASAYVGPGAGITFIGALIGLIVGVVISLAIIFIWPIRKYLQKKRAIEAAKNSENA
jgi:hypothetical protein